MHTVACKRNPKNDSMAIKKFQKQLELPVSLPVVILPYGIIICTLKMILVLMSTSFANH